ncbi:MAG: NapH/MauN family ferredoxin-type protein [Eggerthellaceae bacterium]|nr:NapH/MauN family ferredoxin-type protein [Eggerthellaceae bacterium]
MKKKWLIARRAVQLLMLVLFSLPLLVAGWGLAGFYLGGDLEVPTPAEGVFFGSLSSSEVFGVSLLDPFAILQVVVASKSFDLTWLAGAAIVLVVYGLVRGRVFCGWVCPVNLFVEAASWIRTKLKIEPTPIGIPRRAKVGVAAAVLLLSAITCVPVFEIFSPVSAINKGLLFGSSAGLWLLVAILVIELGFGGRLWCRSICPLGGFYELLGKVGLANVRIKHEACIGCDKCKDACLADPAILDAAIKGEDCIVRAGDCMACGSCVDACPTAALSLRLGRPGRLPSPSQEEGQ